MGQDIFDLIVVLALVYFTGRGAINGFVGEVAGILSLLGGFWLANALYPQVAPHLSFIADPGWRTVAAYVLVFLAVIVIVAIAARMLQRILSFAFIAWVDRLAGALLGLAKGVLLCSLVILVLQTFFSNAPFMRDSRTLPYFTALISQVKAALPADMRAKLGLPGA